MDSIRPRSDERVRTLRFAAGALCAALFLWGTAPRVAMAKPPRLEVAAHMGYQWGSLADETTKDNGVDSLGQALGVGTTLAFGLVVDYHITPTFHLEALWDQQPTQLNHHDRATDSIFKVTDLRVHYYHAGFVYSWSKTPKQPFVGMTMGLTRWQARDGESESGFSFAPVFGYKSWMSDRFGLRLDGRFWITNLKGGELFENPSTGFSYTHTKNTWAIQMQIGIAAVLGF